MGMEVWSAEKLRRRKAGAESNANYLQFIQPPVRLHCQKEKR
jgi:hypothetical protein